MSKKVTLRIIKATSGGWWIKMPPGYDDQGPYASKAEAKEDVPGLERFLLKCNFDEKSQKE